MYGTWSSSLKDEAFQAVEREWSPKLAAASDEILLDGALFARVQAVWDSPEKAKLSPEQARLLWRTYNNFSRLGAKLGPKEKERLSAINQELAGLYTDFGQKVLADEDSWIVLDSEADLAGLPQTIVDGLKAAAEERKLAGKWAVVNTRSSRRPLPHLLLAARPAREGVEGLQEPRRQRQRERHQRHHRQDPAAARREGACSSATPTTRRGSSPTPWRRRPSAPAR